MKKCSKFIQVLVAIFNFIRRHQPYNLFDEYVDDETLYLYSEDYVYVDQDDVAMPTNERFFRKYFS